MAAQQTSFETSFSGWVISVDRTPYQGGELGDESGYTEDQLDAMRARLDEMTGQAVRETFPGADVTWNRRAGWSRVTAKWEGEGVPAESEWDIEAGVRDTMDRVFQAGQWAV